MKNEQDEPTQGERAGLAASQHSALIRQYEAIRAKPVNVPDSVTREQDRDIYICVEHARRAIKACAESAEQVLRVALDINAGNSETTKNIELSYRHLEDASMRLGKALQSIDGGVSVYDKNTVVATPTVAEIMRQEG
jgi:hypothetical protein